MGNTAEELLPEAGKVGERGDVVGVTGESVGERGDVIAMGESVGEVEGFLRVGEMVGAIGESVGEEEGDCVGEDVAACPNVSE